MSYYYSPSSKGFYREGFHKTIPPDGISLTDEDYITLKSGLSDGSEISIIYGSLILSKPPSEIEKVVTRTLLMIHKNSESEVEVLTSQYPLYERMTWQQQSEEAFAWDFWNRDPSPSKGSAPLTPLLDLISTQRGIELTLMVDKVLENAQPFKIAVGKIMGQRQLLCEQAKTAYSVNDIETLKSIKWVSPL